MPLPDGYTFRELQESDFHNDYAETLKVLTVVGEISEEKFRQLFYEWKSLASVYHPHVITNGDGKVVATGMLLFEKKLIHQCGIVGHIEDIAVAHSEQGKKLGHFLIQRLTELAEKNGCYKVILDCSPYNVGFYEKCGYKSGGIEMAKRFDK